MLLDLATLEGIREGRIKLAFRRWKRPTVKSGGTLLTAAGQLHITAVQEVDPERITAEDARSAGFADRASLLERLDRHARGAVYRVELGKLEADPRIALRATLPTESEMADIVTRLGRMDARSPAGPWTRSVLEVISARPSVRAGDLAAELGLEKDRLKTNVRKLKTLGLTESLKIGYRLSPRGETVLKALRG